MKWGAHWAIGGGLSMAAHLVLFSFISLSVDPDPTPDQPVPNTRFNVQAFQVDRTRAQEATPDAEAANQSRADGTRLGQGAIPISRSKAEELQSTSLATVLPAGASIEATLPNLTASVPSPARVSVQQAQSVAAPVAQALTLSATAVGEQAGTATPVKSQTPAMAAVRSDPLGATSIVHQSRPATEVKSQLPVSTGIAAVTVAAVTAEISRPSGQFVQSATPQARLIAAVAYRPVPVTGVDTNAVATTLKPSADQPDAALLTAPSSEVAGALGTDPVQSAALILPSEKGTAALAYSGDAGGQIDPVSLAAIQSFMQPGDIGASSSASGTVRDGISDLLSGVPCARLQVTFVPESGTLQLNGHIPDAGLGAPILAALQTQIGADIRLDENLLILPRPQCGALSGIADVGLPQSTDQITNPLLIGEDTQARDFQYVAGDRLVLDLAAPDYDAFIYVDYFDAAGQVIHLSPNEITALQASPAKGALQIGAEVTGGRSLNITIGPPYGQEIAVAFAASAPLYDGVRPLIEPAEPYLEWLKGQVAATRANVENFKGEWVYFFVTTRAQ